MRKLAALIIPVAVAVMSCADIGKPVSPPPQPDYYPGFIQVEFADFVRKAFIYSWIDSLGLQPYDVIADLPFMALVQVDSGGVERAMSALRMDTAVTWTYEFSFTGQDPTKLYVLVYFSGTVRDPYAIALVAAIPGITLVHIARQAQTAILIVAIGQEAGWIEIVKQFPFVTSAGLVPVTGPVD